MSDSGKALLLIAIVVCLVLMVQPDALASMMKRQPVPRRVLSKAEMQLFTTTSVTGEIVMVGAQGVLIDQGSQAVRVGTTGLSLMTGAAERMSIDSTGKVVLKPTSTTIHTGAVASRPAFGTSVSASEIRSLTAPGADTGFLRLSAGGANTGSTAGSYIDIAGSGSGEMDKNIVFATAGVERIRVLNDGKVGVGTTVASSLLDVYSSSPDFSLRTSGGATTGQYSSILFKNNSHTNAAILGIERANAYGGVWTGDLAFQTYYNSGLVERIRITATGNVGIGTNNPGSNLHVYSEQLSSGITIGRAVTDNNDFRDSWIARPHSIITQTGNYSQTSNNGGPIYLNGSHLFHGTWNAWNSGGAVRLIAGSVFSKGNDGSSTGGHEVGGDIILDSGGVTRLTYGGNGPYTRAGDIHLRTGNVKSVASSAAVESTTVDYTTRLFVSGETGNVGIQTTASYSPLTVKSAMSIDPVKFTVGGTVDKFYPVLFSPVGTMANHPTIQLSRFTHDDAIARGAMALELNWKSNGWGDGAEYWSIKWSYSPNNKFLASVQYEWYGGGFVLYLRGATSYFFRGINATIGNANPNGTNITGANSESYGEMTTIDTGLDYWTGWYDSRADQHIKNGLVGIGTGTPECKLHIETSPSAGLNNMLILQKQDGNSYTSMNIAFHHVKNPTNYVSYIQSYHNVGGYTYLKFYTSNTTTNNENMSLGQEGLWIRGTLTQSSDITLKKNIELLSYGLQTIQNLNPVQYHFNSQEDSEKKHFGLIAQQVQDVLPQLVGKGVEDKLTLSYIELVPVLINAVKEQQQIIQTQNQTIQSLSDRLSKIEAFLSR